ncbi:MAG TPA: dihydrofolate reductase [Candidatus Omnitrophota bacterium]|nr:dihydrofolate reductase [Candidatus Omnitrophota bacterium]HQL41012.1 dihydrofolate reductase [Candidatus Omnitrophota bacterium]
MLKTFDIIVAADQNNGIGKNGVLPWDLPEDMKHFKTITLAVADATRKNAVIMGRKTWESIPERFRPLSGRLNVVLTTSRDYPLPSSVFRAYSLDVALDELSSEQYDCLIDHVFVIGGASVYAQAIEHPQCRKIFLTRIGSDFGCDAFFPLIDQRFHLIDRSSTHGQGAVPYQFLVYERQ